MWSAFTQSSFYQSIPSKNQRANQQTDSDSEILVTLLQLQPVNCSVIIL